MRMGIALFSKISSAAVRAVAWVIGALAIFFLPLAEIGSGFLLGNLNAGLDQPFIFSGRWAADAACALAAALSLAAWKLARTQIAAAAFLLLVAAVLPFLGRAWLEHVDALVSYRPAIFPEAGNGRASLSRLKRRSAEIDHLRTFPFLSSFATTR